MLSPEVLFYNKLRSKVDIEAPIGIYAKVDQQSYNSIVILRDLKDDGAHAQIYRIALMTL
jgi:hypothetical protein